MRKAESNESENRKTKERRVHYTANLQQDRQAEGSSHPGSGEERRPPQTPPTEKGSHEQRHAHKPAHRRATRRFSPAHNPPKLASQRRRAEPEGLTPVREAKSFVKNLPGQSRPGLRGRIGCKHLKKKSGLFWKKQVSQQREERGTLAGPSPEAGSTPALRQTRTGQ